LIVTADPRHIPCTSVGVMTSRSTAPVEKRGTSEADSRNHAARRNRERGHAVRQDPDDRSLNTSAPLCP
jgi:hypothetical protein